MQKKHPGYIAAKYAVAVFVLFFLITGGKGISNAATCTTDECLQIEQIREYHEAGRYVFGDPNWGNAVTVYLNDLDSKIAYMDNIKSYYPSTSSWESTVEALRSNYLFSLNSFISQATLLPGPNESESEGEEETSAEDSEGDEGPPATGATKRIVLTLGNGNKYAWQYVPPTGGQPARLIAEGKIE